MVDRVGLTDWAVMVWANPKPLHRRFAQSLAAHQGRLPNIDHVLTEMADMREANRAYEADLQIMKQSRDLLSMTIDLLKGA